MGLSLLPLRLWTNNRVSQKVLTTIVMVCCIAICYYCASSMWCHNVLGNASVEHIKFKRELKLFVTTISSMHWVHKIHYVYLVFLSYHIADIFPKKEKQYWTNSHRMICSLVTHVTIIPKGVQHHSLLYESGCSQTRIPKRIKSKD